MLPEPNLAAGRAAIARASRAVRRHPDDPAFHAELTRARQSYTEARLTEHVRRIVAEAPPLTADQRARIAALLTGGGDAS